MKFKLLYILFSITLILFLIIIVVLPFLLLEYLPGEISGFLPALLYFWELNWVFILAWLLLLTLVNVFYFYNRDLYLLLEKENWPALIRYLENLVIQNNYHSVKLVRLLVNTYFLLSDVESIVALEKNLQIIKPSLINHNALVFGTAHILVNDIPGALRFFDKQRKIASSKTRDWIRWYYAFSLLLSRQYEKSGEEFSFILNITKNKVIIALSSYFLSEIIALVLHNKYKEYKDISFAASERVKKALPGMIYWNKEVSRLSLEVHAAVISKYLRETGIWLYRST